MPGGAYSRFVLVYTVPIPPRNPAPRARRPLGLTPCSADYAFDGLICHSGAWGEGDGLAVSGLGLRVPLHCLEGQPELELCAGVVWVEADGLAAGGLGLRVPLHRPEHAPQTYKTHIRKVSGS